MLYNSLFLVILKFHFSFSSKKPLLQRVGAAIRHLTPLHQCVPVQNQNENNFFAQSQHRNAIQGTSHLKPSIGFLKLTIRNVFIQSYKDVDCFEILM